METYMQVPAAEQLLLQHSEACVQGSALGLQQVFCAAPSTCSHRAVAQSSAMSQMEPTLALQAADPLHSNPVSFRHSGELSSPYNGMSLQLPKKPVTLQALHMPVHELLQHTPSTQAELQSVGDVHDFPLLHLGQLVPPQSVSLSSPFLMPSLQAKQLFSKQWLSGPQSPSTLHSTHWPLLLQTFSWFVPHFIPTVTGVDDGSPLTHWPI
ncbi:hypothetical protein KEG38_23955 [Polyangium jinanense]|uniref:hypothetical protein n=1 Tax=Polyangium jinanense TaxID=2829994 RepID=UPI0023428810|nr:hypothetical protein [Polyangium jinanense]MDC3956936.1 hypothetical protein [Polyangium jinanense]